jgi:hypothetical protein
MKDYRFVEIVRNNDVRPVWQSAAIDTLAKAGYVVDSIVPIIGYNKRGSTEAVLAIMSKDESDDAAR